MKSSFKVEIKGPVIRIKINGNYQKINFACALGTYVFDFVYYGYNVKRPSYTFYREGAECVTQLPFFHFPSFSPCWPLAFHIFPPPL